MSTWSSYLKNAVVEHVVGESVYTAPADIYVALFSDTVTDGVAGTELVDAGYARQAVAWDAVGGTGATANSGVITFGPFTGAVTINAAGSYDALTVGNLLTSHNVTSNPVAVGAGGYFDIPIGDLDLSAG